MIIILIRILIYKFTYLYYFFQILTNGKYKSCLHRALVNNKTTRYSIAVSNGPSLDTVVGPSPKMVDEPNPPIYKPMKYVDYVDLQIKMKERKTSLEYVMI